MLFTLITTSSLAFWLQGSRTAGRCGRCPFDVETSGLMGISQGRLSALALVISGSHGRRGRGVPGHLPGQLDARGRSGLLLKAFAAVVLGGVGSVWGTLIGAIHPRLRRNVVSATTSGTWTDAVSFAIIIAVLLIKPSGIFSRVTAERT